MQPGCTRLAHCRRISFNQEVEKELTGWRGAWEISCAHIARCELYTVWESMLLPMITAGRDGLLFPRQQPSNSLHKLPTDPKQDPCPNLHLPSFHRGEAVPILLEAFLS